MKTVLWSLVALFLISGTQTWKMGPLSDGPVSYDSLAPQQPVGRDLPPESDSDSDSESGSVEFTLKPVIEEDVYCTLPCGKEHVACKSNNLQPEINCPDDSVDDLEDYKDVIVDFHNKVRNAVAGGEVGKLQPATRMGTMIWDDELQKTAEMQAKLCIAGPNNCHGTVEYKYSGQNSGRTTYASTHHRLNVYQIITGQLNHWYNSSSLATQKMMTRWYPAKWGVGNKSDVGVFTLMVREENTHIGCSMKRYEHIHNAMTVIFICNYAIDNFLNVPVYEVGAAASKCKTGPNPLYENLCSLNEQYFHY